MRIYVAGPYSPTNCTLHDASRIAERNTKIAIDIGIRLMRKGHVVFIPHLSHYIHLCIPDELREFPWYTFDNSFIDHWAEALFKIAPSKGADMEEERARKLGLQIYYDVNEVPNGVLI